MKILGIGNAIVDVICKVEDDFITKNNLTKSTMKLIFDDKEFKELLSNLKIEKTVSADTVFSILRLDNNSLNSLSSKINFMVLLVKLFLVIKSSSTLQITSTIAFPIPNIFII